MRKWPLAACTTIALLAALPAAADPFDGLPALCKSLQKEGWGRQPGVAKLDPNSLLEMSIPGVMYMCTLGRELPASDRGHVPELGALLTTSNEDAGALLTAQWFCAGDRAPALAELEKAFAGVAATLDVALPDGMAAAIREGRRFETMKDGIRFASTQIDVDPDACTRVKPGDLGAVMGKIDVSMKSDR
ncbi:MAG TPA: hypothetical protein VFL14_10940 [Xanthomonadales bacterium]|nr:hypothetical protein [Xanthomonadales bacterium]